MTFFFAKYAFILGFTPAGDLIINDLHRVSDDVGQPARRALYIFSLYPFIDGVVRHMLISELFLVVIFTSVEVEFLIIDHDEQGQYTPTSIHSGNVHFKSNFRHGCIVWHCSGVFLVNLKSTCSLSDHCNIFGYNVTCRL